MPNRVDFSMVTTSTELPGYRIVRNFGIVRGIIVRSRSVIGNLGAALQTIVGGNITILTNLCEKTREDAYELLLQHAGDHGSECRHLHALRRHRSDARCHGSPGLRHRRPSRAHLVVFIGSHRAVAIGSQPVAPQW